MRMILFCFSSFTIFNFLLFLNVFFSSFASENLLDFFKNFRKALDFPEQNENSGAVILYHGVPDIAHAHCSTKIELFEAHMKYLYDNGFEIIEEPTVLDNNKVYSVMSVKYTGIELVQPDYFYYIGKISAQDEIGKTYITKQLKRCRDCANSLKNVSGKENEYEHYLKTAENLEEILNGF